jgi:hypothetical protein
MLSDLTQTRVQSHLSHAGDWAGLSAAVRAFDADVVVLVARKMPRLLEALSLDFGSGVLCISDQAIPFSAVDLRNAKVAIVDDVWNFGSTMLRARDRVARAEPRAVRMFALGAKDAAKAAAEGVRLVIARSLEPSRYGAFVDSVPRLLRLLPKPYDADFPLVSCVLQPGFNDWSICWDWLRQTFGARVHSVTGVEQIEAGVARATVNLARPANWAVKARLYFDFSSGSCNVVPMALAPTLPLENDYPPESMASVIFDTLAQLISESDETLGAGVDARARLNTFCDSLLVRDEVIASLGGLVQPNSTEPFSLADVATQFGRQAEAACATLDLTGCSRADLRDLPPRVDPCSSSVGAATSLMASDKLSRDAAAFLSEGFSTRGLEALFEALGRAVGADNPEGYSLDVPFSRQQIHGDPYLRLRIGFTYREILKLFEQHWAGRWSEAGMDAGELVSMLIDLFIDQGTIVPTFSLDDAPCRRIYRKGEANRAHDDEIERLHYALTSLPKDKYRDIVDNHRTRVAKIMAIMAFAGRTGDTISPGPLERGTVGMLMPSVVERNAFELTGYMRRTGKWR